MLFGLFCTLSSCSVPILTLDEQRQTNFGYEESVGLEQKWTQVHILPTVCTFDCCAQDLFHKESTPDVGIVGVHLEIYIPAHRVYHVPFLVPQLPNQPKQKEEKEKTFQVACCETPSMSPSDVNH